MTDDDAQEQTLMLSDIPEDGIVCPFSRGKWKRAGDALVFFMLFITPILFLIAIITTRLF